MSCHRFDDYLRGRMDREAFERHRDGCRDCRESARRDEALMAAAKALRKEPVSAPGLWTRIENELSRESDLRAGRRTAQRPAGAIRPGRFFGFTAIRPRRILRQAPAILAVLAVAGLGLVLLTRIAPKADASGLLDRAAIARVEKLERAHLAAIEDLERLALVRMEGQDLELRLLYRDKLETIDAQIARCREELALNPGNAHLRRFVLAALQDKQETLAEILGAGGGDGKRG